MLLRISSMLLAFMLTVMVVPVNSVSAQQNAAEIVPMLFLLLFDDAIDPNLPVAAAGPDAQVIVGELVQLDGSASLDPNQLPITFLWDITNKPSASSASLNFTDIENPEFVLDVPGEYVIQLIVNNGIDDSLADSVTIRNLNRAPIADAGANLIELLSLPIMLDGSNSSDIDTDPLTFLWAFTTAPNGSISVLDDAAAPTPSFTPDIAGNYVLELIVNDGQVDAVPDQVEILAGAALTLNFDSTLLGLGRETTGTLSLNFPAPAQGITTSLSVDGSILGLSQTNIQFDQGETEKPLTLTGLSSGQTDLSVSATNIIGDTVLIDVTGALISVSDIEPLSPTGTRSLAISLSEPAPTGGVTIDLEILDEQIATVAPAQVFIIEGQSVPSANPQITGGLIGTTTLLATAPGFAPDVRDITVALAANFNPENLDVPETLTREIVLELDAPAPTGGVVFDLTTSGLGDLTVQNEATITEGQLQSTPIVLSGITEGDVMLTATAAGFVDAQAQITVVDAPDVFLSSSGNTTLVEAVVGKNLQISTAVRLELTPTSAVDIHVSVPANSGVLISPNSTTVGNTTVVFEDVVSTSAGALTIQGIELGDDVPVSIDVFNANTLVPAGYEPRVTTVDVDPSGTYVSTNDFSTTTFNTNRLVQVRVGVLFDDESPANDGELRQEQVVRAGDGLDVTLQSADTSVVELPDGGTGTVSIATNSFSQTIAVTPTGNGITTVSIASQPTGFSLPSNQSDSVDITVIAPQAFLVGSGSASHRVEAVVGLDLQGIFSVRLETQPPAPVDVLVTVASSSGVLISNSATVAGTNQILFEGVTSASTSVIYIQGTAIGDDVPLTVEVFNENTTTPAGYEELPSTVDIDPSGIYITTGDYSTTTFSTNRNIQAAVGLLHDSESSAFLLNQVRAIQSVRGGLDLTVPMIVDAVAVARLPAGANDDLFITAGNISGQIVVEPIGAGQAEIAIEALPLDFTVPVNRDDNVVATVSAPDAFLRSLGSASHLLEATIGIDLQTRHYVRLAVTPPSAVDIKITVPAASGVLLSADPALEGGTELLFENITSSQTPLFVIQGTAIGDDVPFTVEIFDHNTTNSAGYNALASTVDIDPSGTYISSSDYETTTFSSNRNAIIRSAVIFDDESATQNGRYRLNQEVRGGATLNISLAISDNTVAVLPTGASGSVIISSAQISGAIEVDPLTAGQTNLAITAQPNANFTLPSDRNGDIDITVTAPDVRFNTPVVEVGDELQRPVNITLETAPPSPISVTIDVASSAVALISDNASTAGSSSVTFNNVSSTTVGTFYVQGLAQDTATQLIGSAPGYTDETIDINVVDSGFRLTGSTSNIVAGITRNFTISSVYLNPNGTYKGSQAVRGGASFDIGVTSSMPGVGNVTSPITIENGEISKQTTFTAITAGTTTVTIIQPTDFSPPVGQTELDVTVNP